MLLAMPVNYQPKKPPQYVQPLMLPLLYLAMKCLPLMYPHQIPRAGGCLAGRGGSSSAAASWLRSPRCAHRLSPELQQLLPGPWREARRQEQQSQHGQGPGTAPCLLHPHCASLSR